MSDNARESFTDKASSALKPDSQKSGTEQAGDTLKGKSDSAASTMQPDSQKSISQKVGDTFSGNKNKNDEGVLESAKETIGLGGDKH